MLASSSSAAAEEEEEEVQGGDSDAAAVENSVEVEGLGGGLADVGRAVMLLRRCVALLRRALGERHMRVADALERLAEVLMLNGGRETEAVKILSEAETAGRGLLDDAQ